MILVKASSEPLEVQVVVELERGAVPISDARCSWNLSQPISYEVAYIV